MLYCTVELVERECIDRDRGSRLDNSASSLVRQERV